MVKENGKYVFHIIGLTDTDVSVSRYFISDSKELNNEVQEYISLLSNSKVYNRILLKVGIPFGTKSEYDSRPIFYKFSPYKFYFKIPEGREGLLVQDLVLDHYDSSKVDYDKLLSDAKIIYMKNKLQGKVYL